MDFLPFGTVRMNCEIKLGTLIFTKWSTCMIVQIKEFCDYVKEDSADGRMKNSSSFWNLTRNDDLMIHVQILSDRRKPLRNSTFSKTFWIPESELKIHTNNSDEDGGWRVVNSS
tara:strand:- start:6802 stop:7143 length:342 start_codon:yes stop_codon:yes gene_type:complete